MKTAISIPDEVFKGAERLARRLGKSRSQLYAEAIAEYLARHQPDAVTEAMNGVCDDLEDEVERFSAAAAHHVLEPSEW